MVQISFNGWMEEDIRKKRRIANLKAWMVKNCEGNVSELLRRAGRQDKSGSHLREVLAGRKSFGEKLARDLEKELDLQDNSLDKPSFAASPPRDHDWPFSVPRRDVEDLDEDQRRQLDDTMRGMILVFSGQNRKKKRAGTATGNP